MSSSERKAKDAEPGNSHGMPPTLRPFLDQLPPPSTPRTSEEIPRPSVQNYQSDDRTPTKSFFTGRTLERSPSPNDNDEASEEDGDSSTLNDTGDDLEEFESHYSRRSSPASSEDEDIMSLPVQRVNTLDEAVPDTVQRVNSLPASGLLSMTSTSDIPQQFQLHASGSLHTSRSTTSLPYRAPPLPPPLYPPFYNRPPTPLPPSPSLTSLLRPPSLLNRSTTSTRPTTPDSSDVETPNDTEAAVAHSARRANPLPPTAPKVPTYEYYGFVLYLASSLAFLIYILWAYLPSPFLHALGITYYPNRWWALAIPGWIVMMLVYIYVALACWNVEYMTLGLDRVECIVDDAGSVAILDDNGRLRKGGSKKWVSEVEEKRRREGLMRSWGKDGGSARRRKGKEKARLKEERELEEMWYGYTGEVTENGVASGLSWRQIWNEGTDAVMDVPLGGVCEVLYGEGRDM